MSVIIFEIGGKYFSAYFYCYMLYVIKLKKHIIYIKVVKIRNLWYNTDILVNSRLNIILLFLHRLIYSNGRKIIFKEEFYHENERTL